jgi:putative membrane protein
MRFAFDESDMERIAEAIRRTETATSGEIFCVLARSSGSYRAYPLVLALLISLLVPLPLIYLTFTSAVTIYSAQLATALLLALLFNYRSLRFGVVPKRVKHDRAHAEAQRLFAAHGLHQTQGRTGVLIFVSLAERYVEVVADAGISEKVSVKVWDNAVIAMLKAIKRNELGNGFIEAIGICGKVLAEHFPPGAVNKDELPNKLILL